MNSQRVHFVVELDIHEGKLDDFAAIARAMVAGTEKEPGALEYEWYMSKDNSRCRLVEIYANPEAVQAHLASSVVGELVPRVLQLATLTRFEVYGVPDEASAARLSAIGAQIYRHWHGIHSQQSEAASTAAG